MGFHELFKPSTPTAGWAESLGECAKEGGLPFFPIYNLRHTFASRLTAAGVSPLTIANLLGHSSTQVVPRYAQVLDANRLEAIEKLSSLRMPASDEQIVDPAAAAATRHNRRPQ
jgi:integrase